MNQKDPDRIGVPLAALVRVEPQDAERAAGHGAEPPAGLGLRGPGIPKHLNIRSSGVPTPASLYAVVAPRHLAPGRSGDFEAPTVARPREGYKFQEVQSLNSEVTPKPARLCYSELQRLEHRFRSSWDRTLLTLFKLRKEHKRHGILHGQYNGLNSYQLPFDVHFRKMGP